MAGMVLIFHIIQLLLLKKKDIITPVFHNVIPKAKGTNSYLKYYVPSGDDGEGNDFILLSYPSLFLVNNMACLYSA